jgi:hypothetical protein
MGHVARRKVGVLKAYHDCGVVALESSNCSRRYVELDMVLKAC